MNIYLSGSMEKVTVSEGTSWRNFVKEKLKSKDVVLFDPYKINSDISIPYVGSDRKIIKRIVETDKTYILMSDLVIVNTSQQGVGTPQEVLYAYMNNIPVWMFGGSMNPWYIYHSERVFDSLQDLVKAVLDLCASDCTLDRDRLLRGI